ncbi:MAG TPA: hypothetical protein VMV10_30090 [Pirellulales bacterium]|nr:hypothetical protein [Pirellulales bacterium]
MVYSPLSRGAENGEGPQADSPADLGQVAIAAADALLEDLEHARRLSADWTDEELAFALLRGAMDRCLHALAETDCWGKANQAASNEFWKRTGDLLGLGSLQARARGKPRGYAGDHEMFVQFYERRCVEHPLGKLFDRYFQLQAAVEAVRSRTEQIAAAMTSHFLRLGADRPYRAVSVGCGPAIDFELAARWLGERQRQLSLALLDLDGDAVEHALDRLRSVLHEEQLLGVRDNLYRLADKPKSAALVQEADFLVCPGLFDYLSDEAAIKLLRLFWNGLKPRGMLLVGNFAPHNPTRAYMEWIGDWRLIYRAPAELAKLAEAAGIPRTTFQIGAERLGIDLFLRAEKPAA